MPEIYHEMLKGEVISGIIRLEKESDFKEVMLQQGIQSYLFFPILIDDHFFGFVGFDSCLSERE
jgi:GAF domain-containing protein